MSRIRMGVVDEGRQPGWSRALTAPLAVFVRDLKAGLELPQKVEEAPSPAAPPIELAVAVAVAAPDAPRRVTLQPSPEARQAVELVATPAARVARVAPWVFVGGAVATASTAITLDVMSSRTRAQFNASIVTLPDGTRATRLPLAQASALSNTATAQTAFAVTSAVVTAGLAAAAAILFVKD